MATREEIRSDLAIPPGEYLAEVLEEIDMSQADLARRMGRPPQVINEIVKGVKALTPETALQLEQVVSVPAHIWLGLESEYRLVLAEQAESEQVKQETNLLEAFPYAEMAKLGCVNPIRAAEGKVRELRRFFGVASLHQLSNVSAYAPAFRLGAGDRQPSFYGLAAWLRCGVIQSRAIETAPFSEKKLRSTLPSLRTLTMASADEVAGELRAQLSACGVAFALFPHFPKTYAQGATFWVEPRKKAVVLSSVRGKWADIFWFSLFHELGHVLLHGNATFIEMDRATGVCTPEENQADEFARDMLIEPAEYAAFSTSGDLSKVGVSQFAASIGVHPGIVVGRLQHEGAISPDRLNDLRMRYMLGQEASTAA